MDKTIHAVILLINTSDNKKIIIGLTSNGKEHVLTKEVEKGKSQLVLSMIQELLTENRKQFSDLTNITVHPGPGSFTGLRVGIAIANALSYSLNIPLNNQPVGTFVTPQY